MGPAAIRQSPFPRMPVLTADWVADENFHPDETNVASDYNKNQFLDLSKPLLMQVWNAPWGKEYYLQQVHNPRHLKDSARLFGPDFLEMFTRTKWYVVPIFWVPITVFLGYLSMLQFSDSSIVAKDLLQWPLQLHRVEPSAVGKFVPSYLLGCLIWTLLEYFLHRFLFHVDDHLPDANWALVLHFLLHGVHHYLPMDRLRLVMPPLLFFVLETPFTKLAHVIFPTAVANGIIAGAFTFYIGYDCMHYALHHTRLPQYLTEMKRYHLAHHYKSESGLSHTVEADKQTLSLALVSRARSGTSCSAPSSRSPRSKQIGVAILAPSSNLIQPCFGKASAFQAARRFFTERSQLCDKVPSSHLESE